MINVRPDIGAKEVLHIIVGISEDDNKDILDTVYFLTKHHQIILRWCLNFMTEVL